LVFFFWYISHTKFLNLKGSFDCHISSILASTTPENERGLYREEVENCSVEVRAHIIVYSSSFS
jgi:hypothetical protein